MQLFNRCCGSVDKVTTGGSTDHTLVGSDPIRNKLEHFQPFLLLLQIKNSIDMQGVLVNRDNFNTAAYYILHIMGH